MVGRCVVVGVGLVLAVPAWAQDTEAPDTEAPDTEAPDADAQGSHMFMGGHVGTGLQVVQGQGVGTVLSQVEANFRYSTGDWFFRVDLDYHLDPVFFSEGIVDTAGYFRPHYPIPPEYAVVQWKPGKFFLRGGVTNPDFGLQEWDEKDNYLPSYTDAWLLANGQNLGIEPGITFDDGTDLFVFAGYDLAWFTPSFGFGVQTEQDFFGTWSGFFIQPWFFSASTEEPIFYAQVYAANEIYPLDALWISLELNGGFVANDFTGGGQVVVQLFPDAMFGGAVRAEVQTFTDEAAAHTAVDVNTFNVSGAFRADPIDWLHLALEAKESFPRGGGDPYFTGTFYVAVMTPGEPYEDYVAYEEE